MNSGPSDPVARLRRVAERAWAEQARAAERYGEVAQRVASGELDERQVREAFLRFATEEGAAFAGEAARLATEYYGALLDLGREYGERLHHAVLRARPSAGAAREGGEAEAGPRRVHMELRGPAGGEAAGAFVIENQRDEPSDIAFVASDVVDAEGGSPFRAPLELEPPRLTLGPREEATVGFRVPLVDPRFRPGRRYRVSVVVRGHDALELILTVRVERPEEPATRVAVVS